MFWLGQREREGASSLYEMALLSALIDCCGCFFTRPRNDCCCSAITGMLLMLLLVLIFFYFFHLLLQSSGCGEEWLYHLQPEHSFLSRSGTTQIWPEPARMFVWGIPFRPKPNPGSSSWNWPEWNGIDNYGNKTYQNLRSQYW